MDAAIAAVPVLFCHAHLIQNQSGAATGGPMRRNRAFVFGSYEGLRVRPSSLGASAFPLTAAERAGGFSASKAIKDPLTGLQFPNNQMPASRIDAVAGNVISKGYMPLPNRPDGQLVTVFPIPQNNETFLLRTDFNLGKHTVDARYNYTLATEETFNGNVPAYLPLRREATTQKIPASQGCG